MVRQGLNEHEIFALKEDLDARAVKNLIDGIRVVDYDGFVGLVEQHHVVPWL